MVARHQKLRNSMAMRAEICDDHQDTLVYMDKRTPTQILRDVEGERLGSISQSAEQICSMDRPNFETNFSATINIMIQKIIYRFRYCSNVSTSRGIQRPVFFYPFQYAIITQTNTNLNGLLVLDADLFGDGLGNVNVILALLECFLAAVLVFVGHELVLVEMLVPEPEDDGLDGKSNSGTTPDPDEVRVGDGWRDDLTQSRGKGVGEEEQGHDERLHALWGTGVCDFVGGDVAETLTDGSQHDVWQLDPDADWRNIVTGRGCVSAGRSLVNIVLDNGTTSSGDSGEGETEGDSADTAEFDVRLAKTGIDDVGQEGNEDDNGQGVEVAEEIVGCTCGYHGCTLGGGDGTNTTVVDVVDGEVEEDGASLEGPDDIVDILLGP